MEARLIGKSRLPSRHVADDPARVVAVAPSAGTAEKAINADL